MFWCWRELNRSTKHDDVMKFYVGVTDFEWYSNLSQQEHEDINFWQPGGKTAFRVLQQGEPFLFKLKSPYNAIAGMGFYSSHSILPLSLAWDIFGMRNGVSTLSSFQNIIAKYREAKNRYEENSNVGCIVLTDPVFFRQQDWIETPSTWGKSIVSGKSYDARSPDGAALWKQVEETLQRYRFFDQLAASKDSMVVDEPATEYERRYLTKVRIGQGAFRVQLTDAYQRRCSITGEKTLPVLEAAHIKPYADSGPHQLANGILLRADLHKLYDSGYLTFKREYKVEVSKRIREEFENGREYYRFHGQDLKILPHDLLQQPQTRFIEWHNEHVFRG